MNRNQAVFVTIGMLLLALSGCHNNQALLLREQAFRQKWVSMNEALHQRNRTIPTFVAGVKAHTQEEKDMLNQLKKAQADATSISADDSVYNDPAKMKAFTDAQARVQTSLTRLMGALDKNPAMQKNKNYQALKSQMAGADGTLMQARNEYNVAATDYNAEFDRVQADQATDDNGQPLKRHALFMPTDSH